MDAAILPLDTHDSVADHPSPFGRGDSDPRTARMNSGDVPQQPLEKRIVSVSEAYGHFSQSYQAFRPFGSGSFGGGAAGRVCFFSRRCAKW